MLLSLKFNVMYVTEEISLHSEPFCFYGHLQDRKVASKMALKYTKKRGKAFALLN